MAADKIIEKIKNESDAAVEAILSEARERAQQRNAQIIEEANKKALEIEKVSLADAEEEMRRAMLIAELDSRKSELASKRAVIDEAYAAAQKELIKLGGTKWEKLIARIVAESAETGTETLRANQADLGRVRALIPALNAALAAIGKKGELKLDDAPANILGGVIIASETSEINCSIEAVLRDVREKTEREVANLLYGSEVK